MATSTRSRAVECGTPARPSIHMGRGTDTASSRSMPTCAASHTCTTRTATPSRHRAPASEACSPRAFASRASGISSVANRRSWSRGTIMPGSAGGSSRSCPSKSGSVTKPADSPSRRSPGSKTATRLTGRSRALLSSPIEVARPLPGMCPATRRGEASTSRTRPSGRNPLHRQRRGNFPPSSARHAPEHAQRGEGWGTDRGRSLPLAPARADTTSALSAGGPP